MTQLQAEKLTKHVARGIMVVQTLGSLGVVLFLALGFGLVTPRSTLAQIHADVEARKDETAIVATRLDSTIKAENVRQQTQDVEIHALLVSTCLTAKPPVLSRIHLACVTVLTEGEIK